MSALAKVRDTGGWQTARERLLADPLAEISTDFVAASVGPTPRLVEHVAPVPEMREEDRIRLAWEQEQRKSA
jgi:hypothetical protein